MRRGFTTLLAATTVLGAANAAFAAAPSLEQIPVILISDVENNQGSVDNNLFVFTDAFAFADYVTDPDTLGTDLMWSFDYATGGGNVGNIEINGIARLNGGDPLNPGALDIADGFATATFRETDASPTAGSAPFPAPPAGANGVDIFGDGSLVANDVIGDLTVTYYVSDGTAFDMVDSMVFTVDTNLGAAGPTDQAGPGGIPTITFNPITPLSTAGGWAYTPGDGFVTAPATSGETGGLQITTPNTAATTVLTVYTGIWANSSIADLMLQDGLVYAVRATIASNVANTPAAGSKPRMRLEPGATYGLDHQYEVTENDGASPFHPSTSGSVYIAYWDKYDLTNDSQVTLALDTNATGNEGGGPARTVTFSSVEVGSADRSGFTGSATAIPSGTFTAGQFGSWTYLSLGTVDFDGAGGLPPFWEDNASTLDTTGGTLTHVDANEPSGVAASGGAALLNINEQTGPDQIEFIPGNFYWNQFEISAADPAADGDYPAVRVEARSFDPAFQNASALRPDGEHYDATVASGMNGLYNIFWVGPDNGAGAGARADDLIEGFDLFNVNGNATHGGRTTLHAARYWVIGTDDPNMP